MTRPQLTGILVLVALLDTVILGIWVARTRAAMGACRGRLLA